MRLRIPARLTAAAALAFSVTAGLVVAAAPAAHAVGEHSKCTVNWSNYSATVSKAGWHARTGPSTNYTSRGLLYRNDKLTVLCSRGDWNYSKVAKKSASGIPKGTRIWVHDDGLYQLAG